MHKQYTMNIKQKIAILILISSLSACTQKAGHQKPEEKKYCLNNTFKNKIKVEAVSTQPVLDAIHLMGSVEANSDKVVEYVSLINGIVISVNFSLGDKVQKGQILAEIKSVELSSLSNESNTVNAQIQIAQRKLASVQSMYNDGIASEKELTEAKSELEILKSERKKINANIDLYSANASKGVVQIKAPATGIITSKKITPGLQINGDNSVLFTIAALENVWVLANVYASNLADVHTGMDVTINTLSYPDEIFTGKISMIPNVMDEEEKVLKARIELPNSSLKLKPGMLVDISALRRTGKVAIAVPVQAIVFSDNENYVLVYKDDCAIEVRKVNILTKNNQTFYIESGLSDGEKIITENQLLIFEQIKNFEN